MKQEFYNQDGKKVCYSCDKLIGKGAQGKIYKIDNDKCLKHYYTGSSCFRYDVDIFNKIMELDLDNFYKIYELLFEVNGLFKGYVMKYYEKNKIDILTMPVDYTIDNFLKLYDSVKKLSDASILVNDLGIGNVILNDKYITVIDVDLYSFKYSILNSEIFDVNSYILYKLFISLYWNSYCKHHLSLEYEYDRDMIKNLFMFDEDKESVCRKLSRYKYPIDYLRR